MVPGHVMREARQRGGLTSIPEVADALGVSKNTVGNWERDEAKQLHGLALFGLLVQRGKLGAAGELQPYLSPDRKRRNARRRGMGSFSRGY